MKRTPIKKRRRARRGPFRCRKYLDFLKSDGVCIICFRPGCDPCHGPVNGLSSKGPDNEAVPMCRKHHDEQTRLGWVNFEIKHQFSRSVIAAWWWNKYQRKTGKVAA